MIWPPFLVEQVLLIIVGVALDTLQQVESHLNDETL